MPAAPRTGVGAIPWSCTPVAFAGLTSSRCGAVARSTMPSPSGTTNAPTNTPNDASVACFSRIAAAVQLAARSPV